MMTQPVWVLMQTIISAHEETLAEHGGLTGIRDKGLLESALARPQNLVAYSEIAPSLQRLAAAYAYGIASCHPFADGNKRAALIASLTFLRLKGLEVTANQAERYRVFYDLAAGDMSEEELTRWFMGNTTEHLR
ncbi:type II toxin-antitoxin system death-on-curing family toxin [Acidicapsa dinghuensis]